MYQLLAFVCGVIAGAIGAVIYYRRNTAKIEVALKEAEAARDRAVNLYNTFREGGKG